MIAFISFTPHHTLNALIMAKKMYPQEKCDLYLSDSCSGYLEIVESLKKENIFEDVIPCSMNKLACAKYKNKFVRRLKRTIYFVFWRRFLRKNAPVKKVKYSKAFIASHDDPRCLLLTRMKQLNKNLQPFYYEDGANDYLYDSHPLHVGMKAKVAKLVGIKYEVGYSIKTSYISSPECAASADYEYLPIPTIDPEKDVELKGIINRVFGYKEYPINEKVVYLYNRIPSVASGMENVMNDIAAKYGSDSIILKDHPRLHAKGYDGIKRIPQEYEVLWEAMCLNNDFSDKILISHCSTALFTPKFIFDQEPIMIFLFNMLKDPYMEKNDRRKSFEIFVEKLKGVYRDKWKVFLPETEEELQDYLEKVMKDNG